VLAFGASVGVGSAAGFQRCWTQLQHAHAYWFLLALAAQFVAYVGYSVAYRAIAHMKDADSFDLRRIAAIVVSGFGVFIPHGGFAVDVEALSRLGIREREARVRVLGLAALEYAVLTPAAAACAAIVIARGWRRPDLALTLPWLVCLPLGAVLAFWGARHAARFRGEGGWRSALGHGLDGVLMLAARPIRHGSAFLGMALYWAGDIAALWAGLQAFLAHTPSVTRLVLGYAVGYALTRRTLPLAGAGPVEAILPFALSWVGIALAPALLAVVVYRLFNLWLPLVPALVGLRHLRNVT
jgi:hypothetical protein